MFTTTFAALAVLIFLPIVLLLWVTESWTQRIHRLASATAGRSNGSPITLESADPQSGDTWQPLKFSLKTTLENIQPHTIPDHDSILS